MSGVREIRLYVNRWDLLPVANAVGGDEIDRVLGNLERVLVQHPPRARQLDPERWKRPHRDHFDVETVASGVFDRPREGVDRVFGPIDTDHDEAGRGWPGGA